MRVVPELGREELAMPSAPGRFSFTREGRTNELLAGNAGSLDASSHLLLVLVDLGEVEVSVIRGGELGRRSERRVGEAAPVASANGGFRGDANFVGGGLPEERALAWLGVDAAGTDQVPKPT